MMHPTDELLFARPDLHSALETKLQEADRAAKSLTEADLAGEDDQAVVAGLMRRFEVLPITWESQAADITQRESSIDVSGDPRRAHSSGGPLNIPGTEFTYAYKFQGEADLFKFRPSSFTFNPPRGTVRGQELRISVVVPTDSINVDAIAEHMGTQINSINSYLATVSNQVERYTADLKDRMQTAVAARRTSLSSASSALEELKKRQGS